MLQPFLNWLSPHFVGNWYDIVSNLWIRNNDSSVLSNLWNLKMYYTRENFSITLQIWVYKWLLNISVGRRRSCMLQHAIIKGVCCKIFVLLSGKRDTVFLFWCIVLKTKLMPFNKLTEPISFSLHWFCISLFVEWKNN